MVRRDVMLVALLLFTSASAVRPASLAQLLRAAQDGGSFEVIDARERARAEALFARTLAGERGRLLEEGWRSLGFEVDVVLDEGNDGFLVVREREEAKRGRGLYLFRRPESGHLVIEAPHCFYDSGTGPIVMSMVREGPFRAAAFNSVPRKSAGDGHKGPADTQFHRHNYLVAFARAVATTVAGCYVIQIHGFTKSKRMTERGASCEMIVSGGTRTPPHAVKILGAALKRRFPPGAVRIFGFDVEELGALANTNAAALRELGSRNFVHIEVSRPYRERLAGESTMRRSLVESMERYLN